MAIRCTYPACACDSFSPSKAQVRLCQGCKHGWVAHALDKLASGGPYNFGPQVEPVSANVAFDIASLMLYGSQAVPIRLKILLDRMFSALPHDEVLQVLHGFGWSHEDYARGYILLDSAGRMLDKWTVINKDEEYIVVQQFLRFAETRTLAQEIILQETRSNQEFARLPPRTESDIKKFIERNNLAIMQSYNLTVRRAFEGQPVTSAPLFAGLPAFAPHLTGLHHSAFPPASIAHAGSLLLGLKQESCVESVSSPKTSSSTPPAAVTAVLAGCRPRAPEPFDLRTKTPESVITRSPPTSSHSSPMSSLVPVTVPSAPNSFALTHTIPATAGLKVDAYGLPSSSTALRPDFHYVEEGAINLSKDASFTARHHSAAPSPKPHAGASAISRHRQHHQPPASSRSMSVGGGWPYSASFGSAVFVGASGKKRVLCTACNKTFCDKGALKIHYSAVHLKEMHRCTIPGCTMMFSSRRSRNRHSANPNPKLHTPQTPRRPRERLLDGTLGSSLSTAHHALGGSSGNLSQGASMPNSDDSCGVDEDDGMDGGDNDDGGAYYTGDGHSSTDGHVHGSVGGDLSADRDAGVSGLSAHRGAGDDCVGTIENDDDEDDDETSVKGPELQFARRPASVQHPRSNKRKCLMPTRVAAAASVEGFNSENDERSDSRHDGTADGHRDVDSASSDSCLSYVGHSQTVVTKLQPAETPPSDAEFGMQHSRGASAGPDKAILTVPRFHINDIDTKQQSALQALFSSFLPRGDQANAAYWASRFPSGSASESANEPGEIEVAKPRCESDSDCSADSTGEAALDVGSCNSDGIPVDPQNPRQCTACSKVFQNQFYMKVHYQNVHLKLMHQCFINGCTASFPSKRSRDRHSSNVNLHKKPTEGAFVGNDIGSAAHTLSTRYGRSEFSCSVHSGGRSDDEDGRLDENAVIGCDRRVNGATSPMLKAQTSLLGVSGNSESSDDSRGRGTSAIRERCLDSDEPQVSDGVEPLASALGANGAITAQPAQPDADMYVGNGKAHTSQTDKYAIGNSRAIASDAMTHQPVTV